MQTTREGCHYKDYHYTFRRAGQMFSAGNPLQCTIFVWVHRGGCFFVVKQGNVHITLGKKSTSSLKKKKKRHKKKPWHHFFSFYKAFFVLVSVIDVVYKLFYTSLPVYMHM